MRACIYTGNSHCENITQPHLPQSRLRGRARQGVRVALPVRALACGAAAGSTRRVRQREGLPGRVVLLRRSCASALLVHLGCKEHSKTQPSKRMCVDMTLVSCAQCHVIRVTSQILPHHNVTLETHRNLVKNRTYCGIRAKELRHLRCKRMLLHAYKYTMLRYGTYPLDKNACSRSLKKKTNFFSRQL